MGELKRSPRPPSRNKGGLLLRGGEGRTGEGRGRGRAGVERRGEGKEKAEGMTEGRGRKEGIGNSDGGNCATARGIDATAYYV